VRTYVIRVWVPRLAHAFAHKVRIRIVPDDPDVSTRFARSVPPRGLAVASEVCRAATGASLAPADSHAALAQRLKESRCTRLAAPYDARADVYSYGVLLWEIMHERIPFAGLLGIQACFNAAQLAARPPMRLPPDRAPFADLITSVVLGARARQPAGHGGGAQAAQQAALQWRTLPSPTTSAALREPALPLLPPPTAAHADHSQSLKQFPKGTRCFPD